MVTPTFVFSVVVLTMAILAFGTTQTYLRFSAAGPNRACGQKGCAAPDVSHSAHGEASGGAVADGTAHGSLIPSASPTPARPARSARPTHAAATAVVAYQTIRTLPTGFVGRLSITARSDSPAGHWRLSVSYPGAQIDWMDGVAWHTDRAGTVTIEPLKHAPGLHSGSTLMIIFSATGKPGAPSGCRFDGARCRIDGD